MNNWKYLLSIFKGHDKMNSFAGHPMNNFIGGRIYLRKMKLDGKTLKRYNVEKGDFTGSSFYDCWIEDCVFEGCHFEKTNFTEMTDHGNVFNNCDFIACKFNNAVLGSKGTKFINCRFNNCNFTRTLFIRGEFIDTVFINCKMKGIDFSASSFENCSFEGELNDCWFRGGFSSQIEIKEFGIPKVNEMKNVSFEKSELHYLTFSNDCDLSTVIINSDTRYRNYDHWKDRLEYLRVRIQSWDEESKREADIFVRSHLIHAINQHSYIINQDDLVIDYGREVAVKIINALDNYLS